MTTPGQPAEDRKPKLQKPVVWLNSGPEGEGFMKPIIREGQDNGTNLGQVASSGAGFARQAGTSPKRLGGSEIGRCSGGTFCCRIFTTETYSRAKRDRFTHQARNLDGDLISSDRASQTVDLEPWPIQRGKQKSDNDNISDGSSKNERTIRDFPIA
jgi:hypothetical protein